MSGKPLGVACAVVAAIFFSGNRSFADADLADRNSADLVKAALQAELADTNDERAALLKQALDRDPDFAPARWLAGFVRWDHQWVKIGDVPTLSRDDAQLAAYRKKREGMVDTADNHRDLANWCRKHALLDEARVHWTKVLSFDATDAEALQALHLQLHNGRLLTRREIEREKQIAGEQLRAMRTWQPRIVKWRSAIEHGSAKQIDDALAEFGKLADPAALPALEKTLALPGDTEIVNRLNLLLIDAASRMPHDEATRLLVRRALDSDSEATRTAAAAALKKRPLHTFVPQLIALMPDNVTSKFHVTAMSNGSVVHEHEVKLETPQGTYAFTFETMVYTADLAAAARVTASSFASGAAAAAAIEQRVAHVSQSNEMMRKRIASVLKQTTGFEKPDDPKLWSQQLAEHYDWSAPSEPNREFRQHAWQYSWNSTRPSLPTNFKTTSVKVTGIHAFPTPDAPMWGDTYHGPRARTTGTVTDLYGDRQWHRGPVGTRGEMPVPQPAPSAHKSRGSHSGSPVPVLLSEPATSSQVAPIARGEPVFRGGGLVAGSPVLTLDGPRAIESIQQGDRVLAQNVVTGEVAYKVVQDRTMQKRGKTIGIHFGDKAIVASPGHPFWVAGRGWTVAKHLQVGDRLAGVEGTAAIEQIVEQRSSEAYNLTVSDFSTYFAGDRSLLVHDDSRLTSEAMSLPGLPLDAPPNIPSTLKN